MIPEIDIWRVSNLMLKRYGDEADTESALRAEELAEQGDHNGAAVWRRVTDAIGQLARSMHEGKHSSVTLIGCSRFGCNRQQPAWEIVVAAAGLSGRDWVGAGG